jgi:hypothetical protein
MGILPVSVKRSALCDQDKTGNSPPCYTFSHQPYQLLRLFILSEVIYKTLMGSARTWAFDQGEWINCLQLQELNKSGEMSLTVLYAFFGLSFRCLRRLLRAPTVGTVGLSGIFPLLNEGFPTLPTVGALKHGNDK